jgi:hypothetical protein
MGLLLTTGIAITGLLAVVSPLLAEESSKPFLEESRRYLERLEGSYRVLQELADSAAANNESNRLECFQGRLDKVKGLVNLGRLGVLAIEKSSESDTQRNGIEHRKIVIAADRADKLLAEAVVECRPMLAKQPEKVVTEATNLPAIMRLITNVPSAVSQDVFRRDSLRNERNCMRHGQLAQLLARVTGFLPESGEPLEETLARFEQMDVRPLGGWKPDDCATVDDVCVVAALARGLRVAMPDEPNSYWQSLRDDGLAVDTWLRQPNRKGPSPYVLEVEARSFFLKAPVTVSP